MYFCRSKVNEPKSDKKIPERVIGKKPTVSKAIADKKCALDEKIPDGEINNKPINSKPIVKDAKKPVQDIKTAEPLIGEKQNISKAIVKEVKRRVLQPCRSHHGAALKQLKRGKKTGHWIWYVFPTLSNYGAGSRGKVALKGLLEARAYLLVPELRNNYLTILQTSDKAMSGAKKQAPWKVFDSHFCRNPVGNYGPVDSFKVRISVSLFLLAAKANNDDVVEKACQGVLKHFTGDCAYRGIVLKGFDWNVKSSLEK